ncbi:hypothetical protein [Imhoffiella purpurea]|uniref:YtxH domain-containing protein n=1 Tax=Imhoffiella purpurea TaxID=1249627 RepID=W9VK50_9GAMM|nr:hypothetical protein [Imhoffiella purpurea]EXJ16462.1 hypothetical protein D779_0194 [Imhoffiella purpurea]
MSQHYYPQYPGAGQYAAGQVPGGAQGQAQGPGMGTMQPGMQQPGMQQHYAYQPQPYYQQQPNRSLLGMPNDRFLKGLLIGAAVTYLVTNEQVQRTAIKGVVKTWSLLQGGVEEVKERFGDAAAEIQHGKQSK